MYKGPRYGDCGSVVKFLQLGDIAKRWQLGRQSRWRNKDGSSSGTKRYDVERHVRERSGFRESGRAERHDTSRRVERRRSSMGSGDWAGRRGSSDYTASGSGRAERRGGFAELRRSSDRAASTVKSVGRGVSPVRAPAPSPPCSSTARS